MTRIRDRFNKLETVSSKKMSETFEEINQGIRKDLVDFRYVNEMDEKISQENRLIESNIENLKYKLKELNTNKNSKPYRVIPLDYENGTFTSTPGTAKAYVDKNFKFVTCGYKNKIESRGFNIEILKGSNGFPGNTHEANIVNSKGVFTGLQNLNADLNNIKENDKTFEYEVYKVNDEILARTQNLGFHYKEKLSWITKDKKLILKLRMSFDNAEMSNLFMLSPYVLKTIGYSYPNIKSLKIYNSEDEMTILEDNLLTPKPIKHTMTYVFKTQKVKYVDIEFEQDKNYITKVGNYFIEHNGVRFGIEKDSLSILGYDFDKDSKELINPKSNVLVDEETIKEILFNKSYELEVLDAKRFLIGINDAWFGLCDFEKESEIISDKINVDDMQKFKVEAVTNKADIEYFISFNLSEKWHEISAEDPNKIYNASDFTSDSVKYIKYRIKFSKEQNKMPILYDFVLKVEEV